MQTTVNKNVKIDKSVAIVGNLLMAVACIAFILPVFFKNIHTGYQYVIISIVVMLISILGTIYNARKSMPALKILPFLAFNNIVIYFVLFVSNVTKIKGIKDLSGIMKVFHISDFLKMEDFNIIITITIVAFIIAFFISLKSSDIFFSTLFSIEGVVISIFYVWRMTSKSSYGRIVLAASFIVTIIWMFICIYSNIATKGIKRNTSLYSLLFSFVIIAFNVYSANNSSKGLNSFFSIPTQVTDELARKLYPWWLVILLMVIFAAFGAFHASFADDGAEDCVRSYVDAKIFIGAALLALLTKVILSNYFAYSIILYLLFLCVLCLDLKKDMSRINKKEKAERYYDLEDIIFGSVKLVYIDICCIIVLQIVKNRMYSTLLVAISIMYILFKLISNYFHKEIILDQKITSVLAGLPKAYHFTTITIVVLLTASIAFYHRLSTSNLVFLCIIFITVLLVFAALKRTLPKNIKLPELNTVKWCIIVFSIIICIVLTASSGAKIKKECFDAKKTTEISVSVGNKNSIKRIDYQWNNSVIYDGYQSLMTNKTPVNFKTNTKKIKNTTNKTTLSIPVEGEFLTMWITDSNGVKTTKTLWYPIWFDYKFGKG